MSTNTRMQASQFCPLFARQDCNTPIDMTGFGGHLKFGVTPTQTAAGQVDSVAAIGLTLARDSGLEVNADTGSTDLSGDFYVAAIRGNFVHGTADTNSSQIGVLGILNNNTAAFGSGDKYAVRGHLDLWGSCSLTGANVNVGAVSAYVENEATTTVDSGNVLCGLQAYQVTGGPTEGSGVFPARGINPALWIRASAAAASWQTGIYMPVNSVETAIRIGNWVAAGASGSAIPFATAQNVYADGQLDLVAVFGESTSNLTSAYSAKCGRFRHIATGTSLTVAQETYGLIGQMCAKGVTLTHLHGGLMGTFEGSGAAVVLNSSYTMGAHAAVIARVGGHANITATTPLAGFLAFNNGTASIASGTLAAFVSSAASSSYPWAYGLYLSGCARGISFDGVIPPAAAGNYGQTLDCTWLAIDPGSGGSFGAKLMFSNTDTSGYCLYGLGLRSRSAAASAISVGLNVSASSAVASSGQVIGGQFYLQNSSTYTIVGVAESTALYCKSWLDAACSPIASSLWIDDESDTKATAQYMVDITMNGTIEIDDVFHIYGGAPGADTFIDFDTCDQGTGAFVVATASGGGTRSHSIKCRVNGSTVGYLSLYTS